MAKHMKADTEQMKLIYVINHTYSNSQGRPQHATQGHTEVVLRNTVKEQGLWEAGFEVSGGWSDPWFPQKDVFGLFV